MITKNQHVLDHGSCPWHPSPFLREPMLGHGWLGWDPYGLAWALAPVFENWSNLNRDMPPHPPTCCNSWQQSHWIQLTSYGKLVPASVTKPTWLMPNRFTNPKTKSPLTRRVTLSYVSKGHGMILPSGFERHPFWVQLLQACFKVYEMKLSWK